VYVLRSNERWKPEEFWQTYMQLTVVERAFRVLKSELLLRPVWHHYSGRTEAHVFVCVLAYALVENLDHLLKQSGLMTGGPETGPRAPRVIPAAAANDGPRWLCGTGPSSIGDIQLETTDGRKLALVAWPPERRAVADPLRPAPRPPERLSPDRLL